MTRDSILDDVTLYWLTNTGTSSAQLYWESVRGADKRPASVPAAFTVFPDELWRAPRTWVASTETNPTSSRRVT